MAGDQETGVSIMQMDEGLDTGAMMMREALPIGADATTGELHDALAALGARLMPVALAVADRGSLKPTPQPEDGVTYAEKISKSETRIDWSRPARDVHNHIRGLSPFPGAWFEFDGARVKVLHSTLGTGSAAPGTALDDHLAIACGDRAVRLIQVQREGKKAMSAEEFLRGTALRKGTVVS
jgi:methionyl-tRNA formyltransferase